MKKLLTLKTLFVLASLMVVLFLAPPEKTEAQKRRAARIIEGTISGYECGDNCYLTITDTKGKEHTGLCTAHPLCSKWNAEVMMPDSYKGRRVKVTIGKGKLLTGGGDVVGTMDAFTRIQLLTAWPSVSASQPFETKIRAVGARASRLTVEMKEQLAAEMVKNAYNPEYFKNCMDEAGGIDKIIDIKKVRLSNSDDQQYLLTGKADTSTCAFGARTPMHWIYEYGDGRFRMLADIGACDSVQVTSLRTNGYLDMKIGVYLNGYRRTDYVAFKYNGTTYECRNCGRD